MPELRYNRTFKQGLIAIVFGILLFGTVVGFYIVSVVQYHSLVSEMKSLMATIVDIDLDIHIRGPNEQEIYIEYEVAGITYSRELATDTPISFSPGRGAHYSVGDKIQIFYDPQNPEVIASPRSIGVGTFYMVISAAGLALVIFVLIVMLKHHRKFLVTQEEYEKEKEDLKKSKLEEKKQKKQMKLERKKKYAKPRKIVKILLIILAVPVGIYVFLLLFGVLLIALGY